jgi:hypothetical protein
MKGLIYGFRGAAARPEAAAFNAQLKSINAGWKGVTGQLEVLPGVNGPVCCVGLQSKTANAHRSEDHDDVRHSVANAARVLAKRGARCRPTLLASLAPGRDALPQARAGRPHGLTPSGCRGCDTQRLWLAIEETRQG